jgi:hypothetical protein
LIGCRRPAPDRVAGADAGVDRESLRLGASDSAGLCPPASPEVGHGPRVRLAEAPAPYGVTRPGGSGNDDDVADHAHVVVDRADVVERASGGEGDIEGGSWCEGSAVEVATGVVGRVA